jgi:hypothetical protein
MRERKYLITSKASIILVEIMVLILACRQQKLNGSILTSYKVSMLLGSCQSGQNTKTGPENVVMGKYSFDANTTGAINTGTHLNHVYSSSFDIEATALSHAVRLHCEDRVVLNGYFAVRWQRVLPASYFFAIWLDCLQCVSNIQVTLITEK